MTKTCVDQPERVQIEYKLINQLYAKLQHKMASHVNISQFFFVNLTCMCILTNPNAAEIKLIKS